MGTTLLLLDDSRTIHKVFELIYAGSGVQIIPEVDPSAGIAKAKASRPSIVVIDSALSGTDGYELCARVKKDPDLSGIPVLLMGSVQHPIDQDRLTSSGADGSIVKPFVSSDLRAKVEAAMAAAASRPAAPAPSAPAAPPEAPPAAPAWQPPAAAPAAAPAAPVVPPAAPAAPAWQPPPAPIAAPAPPPAAPTPSAAPIIQPPLSAAPVPPPPAASAAPKPEVEEFDWKSFIEGAGKAKEPALDEAFGMVEEEEAVEEEVTDSEGWEMAAEAPEDLGEEDLLGTGPREEDLWTVSDEEARGVAAEASLEPESYDLSAEEEPLELSEDDLFLEEVAEEPTETRKVLDISQGRTEAEAPEVPQPFAAPAPPVWPEPEMPAPFAPEAGPGIVEEEAAPAMEWEELASPVVEPPAAAPMAPPPPTAEPVGPVPAVAPAPPVMPVAPVAPVVPPGAPAAAPAESDIAAAVKAYFEGPGREAIERIAWEVVPELAEMIIRREIERLKKEVGEA